MNLVWMDLISCHYHLNGFSAINVEEQKITYITYTDIEIQPIPNSCANFNQKLALPHLKFRPLFKIWEVQMIPCSNSTSRLIGRVLIFPPFLCITRIQSGTTFGFFWTFSIHKSFVGWGPPPFNLTGRLTSRLSTCTRLHRFNGPTA